MSQLIVAHPALVIRRLSLPALIAVAAIASAFASGHPVFIVGAVGLCVLLVVLFLRSAVLVRSGQVRSGLGRNWLQASEVTGLEIRGGPLGASSQIVDGDGSRPDRIR